METPEVKQPVANQHLPQAPHKKSIAMPVFIAIICILALAISAGVYFFVRSSQSESPQDGKNLSLAPSPAPSIDPKSVLVFQYEDLTFSYDASWKKISSESLLSLDFDNPAPAGPLDITYFFSPTNWQWAQDTMNELKDEVGLDPETGKLPLAAAVDRLLPVMDVDMHYRKNRTAKEFSLESTKSICRGTILASYEQKNPVVPAQIKEIVVAGRKAYMELPQKTCDFKFTSIFFDSNRKNADGTGNSFQIVFNNAEDLDHLSPKQRIILDSIKLQ